MKEEYTYKRRNQLISLFLIFVLITVGINYSNISLLKNWYWEYEPLHVALEIFGALSVILMALVLLQRKQEKERGRFVFIVLGFFSMGILNIFHAISSPGDSFIFLQSMAGLAGALFSSLIWVPRSVEADRYIFQKKGILWLVITLSLLLGTCTFILPEIMPKMLYRGEFTITAILINLLASALFLSTGLYFLRDFYRSGNFESYLFACLYGIFSLASLSVFPSVLWNGEWWAWHLLRQGAYLISLGFIVHWYLNIVAEQKRDKEALQKRTYDLGERVKELNCLYAISKIIDKQDISLGEAFQGIINLIPPAWQYPEIACAQVILEGRVFRTDNFKETIWKQSSDIIVYGNQIGTLEVFCREDKPEEDDGPFLKEERHLINAIARRLGELTEQKRAEEKIKDLAKFPSENPNPVLRVTKDGRLLYANAASLEQLAEWNSGVGKLMSGECYRMIMRSVNSGQNMLEEFTVKDRVFSFVIAPVADTDYVNLYGRDITDRKRAVEELKKYRSHLEELVKERTAELLSTNEQLQQEIIERRKVEEELQKAQKLESLGVLAGGIAHDFNNLLAAIIGNLSLVEQYAKSGASIFEVLGDAKKACYRTKELTRQLLTFSKGGAPIREIASISELVKEVVTFSLRGSKVRCEFDLADNLWPVEIDAGQISQVINNLIINASQAMPRGGIIRLCAENIIMRTDDIVPLKKGKYVKVSIKDQGIGIPKEHLSKIFDPYFTTKERGSGLGLAISYSIVKKHEGYITAESESGGGTTFYIYLPASEKDLFRVENIVEEENLATGRGKILFMDDQESLRDMVGEMLVYLGYEVVFAREGDEAVELYRKAKESGRDFDAVILDLTIPGGTGGKEAVQKLREIDPGVKAIVSSGYSYDPVMSEYKKYGFNGVVVKPYEIGELSKVLYKVIRETQQVSHI